MFCVITFRPSHSPGSFLSISAVFCLKYKLKKRICIQVFLNLKIHSDESMETSRDHFSLISAICASLTRENLIHSPPDPSQLFSYCSPLQRLTDKYREIQIGSISTLWDTKAVKDPLLSLFFMIATLVIIILIRNVDPPRGCSGTKGLAGLSILSGIEDQSALNFIAISLPFSYIAPPN